jgi:hypothetical protein
MYLEKRGKPAPARERRNVFAAIAEAALGGLLLLLLMREWWVDEYLQHEVGVYEIIEGL